jgi:hypothetical protein
MENVRPAGPGSIDGREKLLRSARTTERIRIVPVAEHDREGWIDRQIPIVVSLHIAAVSQNSQASAR